MTLSSTCSKTGSSSPLHPNVPLYSAREKELTDVFGCANDDVKAELFYVVSDEIANEGVGGRS